MGLFSKKPKSIIVQRPATKAPASADALDNLELLLPKVDDLPKLAPPPNLDPPNAADAPAAGPSKPGNHPNPNPSNQAKPGKPPKPSKPPKQNRKATVDPADFLALRRELIDMRARLDESEQARAIVEARLSSLDAAAAVFTN